eukprot:3572657-Rhodomonas_salina.4
MMITTQHNQYPWYMFSTALRSEPTSRVQSAILLQQAARQRIHATERSDLSLAIWRMAALRPYSNGFARAEASIFHRRCR